MILKRTGSMNIRLSFIIPAYNCAEFIDETLGSGDGYGYAYMFETFIPMLKELAESEKSEAGDEFLEIYAIYADKETRSK